MLNCVPDEHVPAGAGERRAVVVRDAAVPRGRLAVAEGPGQEQEHARRHCAGRHHLGRGEAPSAQGIRNRPDQGSREVSIQHCN